MGDVTEPTVCAEAVCGNCGHEWTAVRPLLVTHVNLECPECGCMTGLDEGPKWMGAQEEAKVFVIFDGPPGHTSGRFVEVETSQGESVSVEWHKEPDGTYKLGPFLLPGKADGDSP